MGKHAHPLWLLSVSGALLLTGCSTTKRVPPAPTEPAASSILEPGPARQVPETPPSAARETAPPAVVSLSDGPWAGCCLEEATVAVLVTVRSARLSFARTGVHYLRPARTTTYRLVQVRDDAPVTLLQKRIPEACYSSFHLAGEERGDTGTRYSLHSTLKQFPVDPTRAIKLELRIDWQQNGDEGRVDESVSMNNVERAELEKNPIAVSIEVVPSEAAAHRVPPPAAEIAPEQPADISPDGWDSLHKRFQVTGHKTRTAEGFLLTGEASLHFPEIHLFSERVVIGNDLSLIKLRGPVQVVWDGRTLVSGNALVRVTPELVQFEAFDIQEPQAAAVR